MKTLLFRCNSLALWLRYQLPPFLFWAVFVTLQYPLPTLDDLFFIGAPIHLVQTGMLDNPWLTDISPPFTPDRFFLQPPFYAYALAGWLEVFGISAAALTAFQAFCGAFASFSLASMFWRWRWPVWPLYGATLALGGLSVVYGLRQDLMGVALFFGGLSLLTENRAGRWLVGSFLLASSVATSPVMLAYVPVAWAASVLVHWPAFSKPADAPQLGLAPKAVFALSGAGVACAFLLFLLCIRFEWRPFWHDFALHGALRRPSFGEAFSSYCYWISRQWRPVTDIPVLLFLVAVLASRLCRWRILPVTDRIVTCAVAIGPLANIFVYSSTFHHVSTFSWIGAVLLLAEEHAGNRAAGRQLRLGGLAALLLLLNHSHTAVRYLSWKPANPGQCEQLRRYTREHPDQRYAIDYYAARFVFDYRLPPKATSWDFLGFYPRKPVVNLTDEGDGWVWIVSRSNLATHIVNAGMGFPRVEWFGHRFDSLARNPLDFVLLE